MILKKGASLSFSVSRTRLTYLMFLVVLPEYMLGITVVIRKKKKSKKAKAPKSLYLFIYRNQ